MFFSRPLLAPVPKVFSGALGVLPPGGHHPADAAGLQRAAGPGLRAKRAAHVAPGGPGL